MQRGFSLLEIMIAVAIFAIIGMASYGTLTTVQKADEKSANFGEQFEQLQRAMWIMERDFMQASVRQVRIEGDVPSEMVFSYEGTDDETESDKLAFTRIGWTNPFNQLPRGEVQALMYMVEDNQLLRLHQLYPDQLQGEEPRKRVLVDNVETFKVRFYQNEGWAESWESSRKLPKAVEITITNDTFGAIRRVFLMTGASLGAASSSTN